MSSAQPPSSAEAAAEAKDTASESEPMQEKPLRRQPAPRKGGNAEADRDDAGTQIVALFEAHKKIYPRAVSGVFARWRVAMVLLTQLVYYGTPWLSWNDRQAVLFDLAARKFYIFGLVLYPQDFIFLTGLLVISALSLFLFTAVAGRLWCGYACPQTVYTELFMWIERRIEGDRNARMKLDAQPWGARKLGIKAAKQGAWLSIALWTGITFVGYFTPIRSLLGEIVTLSLGPWQTFWILFYSFATYGNAGFMREQVCKYMCPYARFQSAMFDKDTLTTTQDEDRGEPRGSRSRKVDPRAAGLGDCIDCGLCVQVCPTGIDIRKGLQYECIGCAACVDVCNGVMEKMDYPQGLIRYSTQHAMDEKLSRPEIVRRALRPRTLVYFAILGAIVVAFVVALFLRTPLKVDVIRDRAALARIVEDGRVENVYRFQIMNATEQPATYALAAEGLPGIAIVSAPTVEVPAAQSRMVAVRVQVPPDAAEPGSHEVRFEIVDTEQGHRVVEEAKFLMPR